MDKCKEYKHTIFTGKNIFEKINEINKMAEEGLTSSSTTLYNNILK